MSKAAAGVRKVVDVFEGRHSSNQNLQPIHTDLLQKMRKKFSVTCKS